MGKTNKDGKPRGRMSAYAFFVQTCREEHKKKHPGESVVFAEFSKKCAAKWKSMGGKEKKRFEDMAAKDKDRYEAEMETYTPPPGTNKRKKKQKKDPDAPKRALSAFFFFCAEERPSVRKTNPEWGVGDVAKELGRRWEKNTEKPRFEAMSVKDKARYEKEMATYRGGGGGASGGAKASPKKQKVEESEEDEDDEDEDDDDDDDDDE